MPEKVEDRPIIDKPHLSSIFLSQATNTWKVAFSAPIEIDNKTRGIVAVTVELGNFVEFPNVPNEYVMMIDDRKGSKKGTILEHPLIDELRKLGGVLPKSLSNRKLQLHEMEDDYFYDPMGEEEGGQEYRQQSIFAQAPVEIQRKPVSTQSTDLEKNNSKDDEIVSIDTGFVLLAVEDYQNVIEPVNVLRNRLLRLLLAALLILAIVAFGMWWLVNRTLQSSSNSVAKMLGPKSSMSWMADRETMPQD